MGEFRMPSLGADMDAGTIIEWLVRPGDAIKRGQVVAVVDTAKAAMEIEAFESGVLEQILVDVGTQVAVGTPLAIIGAGAGVEGAVASGVGAGTAATAGPEGPPARPAPPGAPAPAKRRKARAAPHVPAGDHEDLRRATPPVRHLAHQLGVDLAAVAGTGPDGHVTHEDVLGAAAGRVPVATVSEPRLRVTPRARRLAAERGVDLGAVSATGAAGTVLAADVVAAAGRPAAQHAPAEPGTPAVPPTTGGAPGAAPPRAADPERRAAMRTAIANLMSRSNAEIPHYYVQQTMDLGPALAWLRAGNAALPAASRLLPAVLFLRATVLAAQAVPELNGHWVEGALRPAEQVDLGVAVATRGGGLITPAIPDAGALGIHDLMARLADLVGRARRGTLKQAEMAGGSITVSSLGETGPDALAGVIFPPQVALVGVGGIVERPWAVDGMLTVRPTATITLAADHRASDGRTASAFLAAFAHALAHPEEL